MRMMVLAACCLIGSGAYAGPVLDSYATSAVGHFSSVAQHQLDDRYDEVDASIVRIWPDREGVWLYQEQSILTQEGVSRAAALAKPYFQRVGHIIEEANGKLRRDNYVLKAPARFVGLGRPGYAGPMPTADDLGPAGCPNVLSFVAAGHFTAKTEGCENNYRGAVGMVSQGITTPEGYANWDLGVDAKGARVWGPAAGGYVFKRVK